MTPHFSLTLLAHAFAVVNLATSPAARAVPRFCSIEYADGSRWQPSVDNARQVARDADVIVRARAIRGDSVTVRGGSRPAGIVVFEVLEVIAGKSVPRPLKIYGQLSALDDFNRAAVPYPAVRASGQLGSCYAREYREGGEFLLLLKRDGTELTPYWAPLAPTNEQVHGADDPWVTWVRAERVR